MTDPRKEFTEKMNVHQQARLVDDMTKRMNAGEPDPPGWRE
jgi:hypothetical protein